MHINTTVHQTASSLQHFYQEIVLLKIKHKNRGKCLRRQLYFSFKIRPTVLQIAYYRLLGVRNRPTVHTRIILDGTKPDDATVVKVSTILMVYTLIQLPLPIVEKYQKIQQSSLFEFGQKPQRPYHPQEFLQMSSRSPQSLHSFQR